MAIIKPLKMKWPNNGLNIHGFVELRLGKPRQGFFSPNTDIATRQETSLGVWQ